MPNRVEIIISSVDATKPATASVIAGTSEIRNAILKLQVAQTQEQAATDRLAAAQFKYGESSVQASVAADRLVQAHTRAAAAEAEFAAASEEAGLSATNTARAELEDARAADMDAAAHKRLALSADAAAAAQRKETVAVDSSYAAKHKASKESGTLAGGLGAVAKAATGVAIVAGVVAVSTIHMASTFQTEMEKISTQAGVPQAAIAGLGDGVLKLAGQVGSDPTSLAQALYHIESSFASTGTALELLKVAAEGAKVGGADLVEVTNALDAAVVSGIPGVNDLNSAMGILNATVGAGDMSMQDLAKAFGGGAVAVVKNYGLNIKDVGAALALFGDNNIRGAAAGTALRVAVQALAVPAAAGKYALHALGLTTDSLAKDMRSGGLNKAITDLHDRLVRLKVPTNEWGQITTEIFGKKAGTGVAVLLGQYDRLQTKYHELTKGASGFGAAWAQTQKNMSQQWDQFINTIKAGGVKLGEYLLPGATKALGAVTAELGKIPDLLGKISKDKSINEIAAAFSTISKDVGAGLATGIGVLSDAWKQIEPAVKGAWDSMGPIIKQIFTNPEVLSGLKDIAIAVVILAGAFVAIAAAGAAVEVGIEGALIGLVGWMTGTFVKVVGFVVDNVIGAFHDVVNFFKKLPGWFASAFKAIGDIFSKLGSWILDSIKDIGAAFAKLGGWILSAIKAIPGFVRNMFVGMFKQLMFDIGFFVGAFISFWVRLPGWIIGAIKAIPGLVTNLFKAMYHAGVSNLTAMRNFVSSSFKSIYNSTVSSLTSMRNFVSSTMATVGKWLWTHIRDGINSAINFLRGLPGKSKAAIIPLPGMILSVVRDAGKWLFNTGKNIVAGLVNGVKSAIGSARDQIGSMISSATSSVTSGFSSGFGLFGKASGGVIGTAATGGVRSGLTMVGEHGRELVRAAPGSHVYSNPDTERMLGQGGSGGQSISVEWVGGNASDEFVTWLIKNIRIRPGLRSALKVAVQ